jgi:hypothetical protein
MMPRGRAYICKICGKVETDRGKVATVQENVRSLDGKTTLHSMTIGFLCFDPCLLKRGGDPEKMAQVAVRLAAP